jgi:hypothetical protein
LSLAKECRSHPTYGSPLNLTSHLTDHIPVIVVFTKFDLLVRQHIRQARLRKDPESDNKKIQERNAEEDFNRSIKGFRLTVRVPCARISTHRGLSFSFQVQELILTHLGYLHTLRELTELTRQRLHDVEGELWVPWAFAQQISARQKVEQSIRYGLIGNWRTLELMSTILV